MDCGPSSVGATLRFMRHLSVVKVVHMCGAVVMIVHKLAIKTPMWCPRAISRDASYRVLQVTLSYKIAPALFLRFALCLFFCLSMGKRRKTWADGCERFLEQLEDPKDRQKFQYVLDKLDMDDPWDIPPSLCSGLEQACICRLWGCLPW